MPLRSLLLLIALGCLRTIAFAQPPPASDDHEFFEKQIRPLLVAHCYECHSGTKAGGGLSLDTAAGWQRGGENGPAIKPSDPEQSLLINALHYRTLEMPPPDQVAN